MDPRPSGVGLGGDGDEIAALEEIEAQFGVKLDTSDAKNWFTAGDIYRSLLKALPAAEAARPDTWARFAQTLTRETGADPASITPESPLLGAAHGAWKAICIQAAVAIAVVVGVIMLFR